MPTISVIMPSYNTPLPYLKEAVESILNQSFQDFEFIILDDGSTDDSPAYLNSLTDPRIRIIRNEKNIGITKSLNIGLRAAKGKYIARMDSDDVSLPQRFEKQYAFMEAHPDVFLCGSKKTYQMGAVSKSRRIEDMDNYRAKLLFRCHGPAHPTVFIRREMLEKYHVEYDERLRYAQDYRLFMTVCQLGGKICILPDILLFYRKHEKQVTSAHLEEQIRCAKMTQRMLLSELLDDVSDEELDNHYFWATGYYREAKISPEAKQWFDRLLRANRERRIYNQRCLQRHTIMVESKLIRNAFVGMSFFGKVRLFLQYIPLGVALDTVLYQLKFKLLRY